MNIKNPSIQALGDRGVLVKFDEPPSQELTERLVGISVAASTLPGVVDAAPGLCSVLIELGDANFEDIKGRVPELVASSQPLTGTLHELPLIYNGEDFDWALFQLGLSDEALIRLHSAPIYDVRLLGSPGFVYLSNVVPELALPRMETPRREVAAGSVGIGGRQAGILHGRARPGGWRILATASSVPHMRPGDRVRFVVS